MEKLKIAVILIILAFVIFALVMTFNKWDFKGMFEKEYVTNTYEITEHFDNIKINVTTADIEILKSQDGKCKIVVYEDKEKPHTAEVVNESLEIKQEKKTTNSFFNFGNPKITIYLANTEYQSFIAEVTTGDLIINNDFTFNLMDVDITTGDIKNYASVKGNAKIETTTGEIVLENFSANNITLTLTTGDVTVKNVKTSENITIKSSTGKAKLLNTSCKNLTSNGTTGKIELTNLIASEKIYVKRSTGDVIFDSSDANEIFVDVTTGDVLGTLLTDKTFNVETTTGDKQVPQTTGGLCKIHTTTGDVIIKIK